MKARHMTQREHAQRGREREVQRFRARLLKLYDIDPAMAAGFVRGMTCNIGNLNPTVLLEDFIARNSLRGHLLREALQTSTMEAA